MKTQENLMAAFAGESQANRRYLAFAKVAEKEGKTGLAKLFRVAAEGETVHALAHLENAGKVKSSEDNLKEAIAGETYEFTKMYPQFIDEAKAEERSDAHMGFFRANAVEKTHEKLFSEALEKGGDIEEKEYFICSVCGHPEIGEAPERCPVCGAPKEKFYKFV
ncbi:MAG TPA: rubrerythrin [Candidatus Moranbacteria bacterium]|nr:MAG: Rubrerythrin [Candidatus Moranbacteria bacterium GW2011_GWC2_45_10]KKT93005.1 MAG: rubrerythrin [Parcubacteria group bacterium GW2011_GWC1_45_14]HAV11349.1 rubrerythrin [Candidatus Moranbacteria bacterium]